MSILIKGMEMPKSCEDCPMCHSNAEYDYAYCCVSSAETSGNKIPSDCPLVPVPPHGRLGNLSALAERLEDLRKTTAEENPPTDNHGFNNGIMCGIGAAINEVRYYTPTVIPAEEGE